MKRIILYTSDNHSDGFIDRYIIVDKENIQDIIDSLIIDECAEIRVFELGNEITDKFDTDN